MYARSSTFRARPDSVDAGVAFMRDEVMPAVLAMPGCSGMSMMADRRSGRCIATTAWDAMEPMRASAGQIAPMRERGAVILGAVAYEAGPTGFGLARGEPFIEEWEIAVLHRAHRSHEGACVRATTLNPRTVTSFTWSMTRSARMSDPDSEIGVRMTAPNGLDDLSVRPSRLPWMRTCSV